MDNNDDRLPVVEELRRVINLPPSTSERGLSTAAITFCTKLHERVSAGSVLIVENPYDVYVVPRREFVYFGNGQHYAQDCNLCREPIQKGAPVWFISPNEPSRPRAIRWHPECFKKLRSRASRSPDLFDILQRDGFFGEK